MGFLRYIWNWNWNKKSNFDTREGTLLTSKTEFNITEAYKAARTNLRFSFAGEKGIVFTFTSSQPGEGKTTTCLNMAITFAQAGLKTLIIDGDLRKPQIHRYFKFPAKPGLSDRLAGFTSDTCIRKTEYDNLSVLTIGTIPPNPAELLGSPQMRELVDELKESFDYVFIDAPPINVVTDAAVLSPVVNGLVLVIRQGYTTTGALKDAIGALQKVKANIIGFVLNDVKRDQYNYKLSYRGKYRYKYGYTRYGYSRNSSRYQDYRYGSGSKYGYFRYGGKYGSYGSSSGGYGKYGGYGDDYGGYDRRNYDPSEDEDYQVAEPEKQHSES